MISLNEFYDEDAAAAEARLRTRDIQAQRRSELPVDYKFDRAPRGKATNKHRRRRHMAPIKGIHHRRNKKIR